MIYNHANHVLVWLGQEKKDPGGKMVAESAFKLVHELNEVFQSGDKTEENEVECRRMSNPVSPALITMPES